MVENVVCDGCSKELEETETIYECENCDKLYCEKCKGEHKCLTRDDCDEHTNEVCVNCSSCEEEMYNCPNCEEIYCEDCIDEHIKDCSEQEFEEWELNDYIKDKITENLETNS